MHPRLVFLTVLVGCSSATSTSTSTPVGTPTSPEPTPTVPTPDPCVDEDGDTFGVDCDAGPDCDDTNPDVHATLVGFTDGDGDGVAVDDTEVELCVDELPMGLADAPGEDCDDADASVSLMLEGYPDADGDGEAAPVSPESLCEQALPAGYLPTAGTDCDDEDPDNQISCASCVDADGDGAFVGCDLYVTRVGPDCDDADANAYPGAAMSDSDTACMRDADGDGYGDAMPSGSVVAGSDCDDARAESWSTCLTCVDADGDGVPAGCDSVPGGEDCNDGNPNEFANCGGCTDADRDKAFTGCDAYVTLIEDCDDSDPNRHPTEPELADDGIDNDCDGVELSAQAPPLDAHFVNPNDMLCDDAGDGSSNTPYCSLYPAIRDPQGGPIFMAGGTVVVGGTPPDDHQNYSASFVGLYGGYDSSDWSRDPDTQETILDITGSIGYGVQLGVDRVVVEHITVEGSEATGGVIAFFSSSDETFLQDVEWRGQAGAAFVMQGRTLVRDSSFEGTAWSGLLTQNVGELTVVRSRFDHTPDGSGGNSITVNGDRLLVAHSEFVSSHTASGVQPILHVRDADVALLNNSFVVDWPIPGSGNTAVVHADGTFPDRTITLLNNATRAESAMPRFYQESSPSGDFVDLVARNNVLFSAPGANAAWSWRRPGAMPVDVDQDADAFNSCVPCLDVRDNLDADPAFVDPDAFDLRPAPGSALIDAGVDLRVAYDDWYLLSVAANGLSRPSGTAWDIGAHELNE